MTDLLFITKADYMDWMSVIVAILALLIMILIGWQIWNYVYFEKKLDAKINNKLDNAQNELRKEYEKQIALSNYYSYLKSAASHQESFGWHPHIVLNNLAQAIEEIIKIENFEVSILTPLVEHLERLCKLKTFEDNHKAYAEGVDNFIPKMKLLLGKSDDIYNLLIEIEKQKNKRKDVTTE